LSTGLSSSPDAPGAALQSAFDALYPAGLQWYWTLTRPGSRPTTTPDNFFHVNQNILPASQAGA